MNWRQLVVFHITDEELNLVLWVAAVPDSMILQSLLWPVLPLCINSKPQADPSNQMQLARAGISSDIV